MNRRKLKDTLLGGLIRNNPTFVLVLGTCPTIAMTTTLFQAFAMGIATTFVLLFSNLFVSLWSLLLIVPGIVKALAWSQVPYLLAENPNLTGARAREISEQMTDGQKWEIFLLQLSFLGWYLLGALACGVGVLFVDPYVQATHAELYARLRDRALREGFATLEELPGLCPAA